MNVASTVVKDANGHAEIRVDSAAFELPRELLGMLQQKQAGNELSLGVRPEGILVSRDDRPGYLPVEAHIIQPFGGFDIVDLKVGNMTMRARTTSGYVGKAGDRVWARIDPTHAHFFDSKSGASLGIRLGE
jgi:multiple sugar transport system ATP-binding protein